MQKINVNRILAIALLSISAIAQAGPEIGATKDLPANLKLDKKTSTIDPGVDFYTMVNQSWLNAHKIPKDQNSIHQFSLVQDKIRSQLEDLVISLENKNKSQLTNDECQLKNFYTSVLTFDLKQNNLADAQIVLNKIEQLQSKDNISTLIAELAPQMWFPAFINIGVHPDQKNSNQYKLYIGDVSTGLPAKSYYFATDKKSKQLRTDYINYLSKLFVISGASQARANILAKQAYEIEKALAVSLLKEVEYRDTKKTYNLLKAKDLDKYSPGFKWSSLFAKLNLDLTNANVIAINPASLSQLSKVIARSSLGEIKAYMQARYLAQVADAINQESYTAYFTFYMQQLQGVLAQKTAAKRAIDLTKNALPELLGKLYIKKHVQAATISKVNEMVITIKNELKNTITHSAWMSAQTKTAALEKLKAMQVMVGYPEKWRNLEDLNFTDNNLFKNYLILNKFNFNYYFSKLNTPVDKNNWDSIAVYATNAYYTPTENNVRILAGILVPPFFDKDAPNAVNYGALGAVIGHEMTHGFDDQGRHFNKNGNMQDWWTKEDAARFNQEAQKLVKQFSKFKIAPNQFVNGQLTLGENIADYGGLTLSLNAYLKQQPELIKNLNGFNDRELFFMSFANIWAGKRTPESASYALKVDPHSPLQFRVNGGLFNLDAFYKTYQIKTTDPLYLAPSERVKIWSVKAN